MAKVRTNHMSSYNCRNYNEGFTLIEVLVSMVMITIALLGFSGLLATGIGQTQQSFNESQAIYLLQDLSNRMKANINGVNNNHYFRDFISGKNIQDAKIDSLNTLGLKDCSQQTCNPEEMADYDINEWLFSVKTLLALSAEDESLSASICQISPNGICIQDDPLANWRLSMRWGGEKPRVIEMSIAL